MSTLAIRKSKVLVRLTSYIWETHEGERISVRNMETSHLFYTVRMVFNHTAPEAYQIPGCKRWRFTMPLAERTRAVGAMLAELTTRKDLLPEMLSELQHMQDVARRLLTLPLNETPKTDPQ